MKLPVKAGLTALALFTIIAIAFTHLPPSPQPPQPVLGPQSILVVRLRPPGVSSSLAYEHIYQLVFQELDAYYRENSWNQIRLTGKVTDKVYVVQPDGGYYDVFRRESPVSEHQRLALDALKVVDEDVDFRQFSHIIIVYAGEAVARRVSSLNFEADDGTLVEGVIVLGETSFYFGTLAHEFGHSLGLPDLYEESKVLKGEPNATYFMGSWCIMSQTEPGVGMGAWARLKLGWVPSSYIAKVSPSMRASFQLTPLELSTPGTHVIKIPLTTSKYYLVEARMRIGSDLQLTQEGVVITLVDESIPPEIGGIRVQDATPLTSTLDDGAFDFAYGREPVFWDYQNNLAITVLERHGLQYTVRVETAQEGEWAARVAEQIMGANGTIHWVADEAFPEGIEEAKALLASSYTAFVRGDYEEALMLAGKANSTAISALWPEEMRKTHRLIVRLKVKLEQANNEALMSTKAMEALSEAWREWRLAFEAWQREDYEEAAEAVKSAMNAFAQAIAFEVMEFPERTEELTALVMD